MQTNPSPQIPNSLEASSRLAKHLATYSGLHDPLVLTLPNGGVSLGAKVAALLNKPFDILFVEKITAPGCGGMAMGAITGGGVRVLNAALVDRLRLSQAEINTAILQAAQKLARRERTFRSQNPPLQVAEHSVILIDDGSSSCEALRDAVHLLRRQHAEHVIVAFPANTSQDSVRDLSMEADEVVSLTQPATSQAWHDCPLATGAARHQGDSPEKDLLQASTPDPIPTDRLGYDRISAEATPPA